MSKAEKLFDAMIKTAIEEAVEQEMAKLPSDESLNAQYPTSDILDKKVMRIIARENRVRKRNIWRNLSIGIAASFALVFTIGAVGLMNFHTISDDFAVLEYAMPDAPAPAAAPVAIAEQAELYANRRMLDTDEELYYGAEEQWAAGQPMFIEIDDFRNYTTYILEQEVYVFEFIERGLPSSISWNQDGIDFHISGDRHIDELIAVVERFLE